MVSIEQLTQQRWTWNARREQTQRLYDDLRQRVADSNRRIAWKPQVVEMLEHLQTLEHERSVGAFERLLSALLQDVMDGERWVSMDLYNHGGLPALDFFIQKAKDAPREDALFGTGGSVTNVLSAGLRLIALIRSGRRRFLVLDEADCWLKPALVPRFAAVIQQMATDLGVQVVMISHHDESLFDAVPHRLVLTKTDGGLGASWSIEGQIPEWSEGMTGIRSLYLENFLSHTSTFLPLSPGITLLRGDNDIGKSAIVAALRAVFYGGKANVNDALIHHHENLAKVIVDFGDKTLFWERRLKGKPKEMFMLIDPTHGMDNPLHHSESAKDFPVWVEQETGIGLVDGMDVMLGQQQDPIFLLNKPNTQRASALAIGSESSIVQRMMALDKADLAEAKNMVKQGEQDLEKHHRELTVLKPLIETEATFQALQASVKDVQARQQRLERMRSLADRWDQACVRHEVLRVVNEKPGPQVPNLHDLAPLRALLHTWTRSKALKDILGPALQTDAPTLPNEPLPARARALMQAWAKAQGQRLILTALKTSLPPACPDEPRSTAIKALAQRWDRAQLQQKVLSVALAHSAPTAPVPNQRLDQLLSLAQAWTKAQQQAATLQDEVQRLKTQERATEERLIAEFPACPTCERPWSIDDVAHEHAHASHTTTPSQPVAPLTSATVDATPTPAAPVRRSLLRREI